MPRGAHSRLTLTSRDNAILELLQEGFTNKQIAARMGLGFEFVKESLFHIRDFYTRQGHDVSTRVRLANVYRETT